MTKTITINELVERMDTDPSLQLIDVRSPAEYASGHVPRALNLPLEQVESRLDDLGTGAVAILCQSGTRASMACSLLQSHHPDLMVVEGGTEAWMNAGKPVAASSSSRWSLDRQVRLIAGLLVLVGTVLAVTVSFNWIYLSMFVGAGLTFAGLTNVCGMAMLLAKLPWNQPRTTSSVTRTQS